jgi:hypothetical protein
MLENNKQTNKMKPSFIHPLYRRSYWEETVKSAKTGVHILKGFGSLNWAYFVSRVDGMMDVTAILGAVTYIDRTMTLEAARAQYRELQASGWKTPAELRIQEKDIMSLRTLQSHIYN